jgi:hypothetical protein
MFLRVARRACAWETSQPPTAITTDAMIAAAATISQDTDSMQNRGYANDR